jgi:hypothetical protein
MGSGRIDFFLNKVWFMNATIPGRRGSSKDDLLASIRNAGIGILKPAAERASTSTAHTSAGSYGAGYEDSGTGAGEEEDTAAALKRALAERMKRMGDSDSEDEDEDGEWED